MIIIHVYWFCSVRRVWAASRHDGAPEMDCVLVDGIGTFFPVVAGSHYVY
jgi:hypothetical protein